jgi:regulator of sirC expression with transglutaminase-like and TPR domain
MSEPLQFAAPTALEYFSSLVADDASLSLIEAAVSIAQDDYPDLDTQAVLADIDTLADRLRRRIPADAVPVQRLRWLNRYFFRELGFAGNVNDYYDPRNSYLHMVLSTRRGIPITLAVLYIELATQIGLTARGVSFPGHFLIKLRMHTGQQHGEVVIDPFTGHSLSREELDELLGPYKRSHGLMGEFDAPLGLFLQSAPPARRAGAHAAQPEGNPPQRAGLAAGLVGGAPTGHPAARRLRGAARPRPGAGRARPIPAGGRGHRRLPAPPP